MASISDLAGPGRESEIPCISIHSSGSRCPSGRTGWGLQAGGSGVGWTLAWEEAGEWSGRGWCIPLRRGGLTD